MFAGAARSKTKSVREGLQLTDFVLSGRFCPPSGSSGLRSCPFAPLPVFTHQHKPVGLVLEVAVLVAVAVLSGFLGGVGVGKVVEAKAAVVEAVDVHGGFAIRIELHHNAPILFKDLIDFAHKLIIDRSVVIVKPVAALTRAESFVGAAFEHISAVITVANGLLAEYRFHCLAKMRHQDEFWVSAYRRLMLAQQVG